MSNIYRYQCKESDFRIVNPQLQSSVLIPKWNAMIIEQTYPGQRERRNGLALRKLAATLERRLPI